MNRASLTSPYFRRDHISVKDLKASVNNAGFVLSYFIILLVLEKSQNQVIKKCKDLNPKC